jgi:hypothetical protein
MRSWGMSECTMVREGSMYKKAQEIRRTPINTSKVSLKIKEETLTINGSKLHRDLDFTLTQRLFLIAIPERHMELTSRDEDTTCPVVSKDLGLM